jgi:uncharacterized membrane protein
MIGMAANVVVALVALLHAWFLVLEMFLWDRPIGMRTFRLTPERARDTRALAANQGRPTTTLGMITNTAATTTTTRPVSADL